MTEFWRRIGWGVVGGLGGGVAADVLLTMPLLSFPAAIAAWMALDHLHSGR